MENILRNIRLWLKMSIYSFISVFHTKASLIIFVTGKVARFCFFSLFIFFLVKGAGNLAGYNVNQIIFFFLTFNLIDILSQFLFREVYRFRPQIVSGSFDLTLTKPINPLLKSLLGGADLIDLITIPPLLFVMIWVGRMLNPSLLNLVFYIFLIVNSLLISAAFHIFILGLGIITFEIDHLIMIYRDLVALGRFPIDIYREPVRLAITYFIPIGIMISLPAKAFLGVLSPLSVGISFLFGAVSIVIAIKFWNAALKKYTSASS